MTKEEYNLLKAQAHEQMKRDYQWLMSQEPTPRQWRCPQRWLIEFVYDSNEERTATDEFFKPIPLSRLYEDFFLHTGSQSPKNPCNQLCKLRAKERLHNIKPDYITLYYMQQMEISPTCRIIELLMETK